MKGAIDMRAASWCLAFVLVATTAGLVRANSGSGSSGVPEIGPNSMATALTVLVGGVILLTGWRRKKK
jgi:hypothetical protein